MSEPSSSRTAITLCGSLRRGSVNEILRRHVSQELRAAGVAVDVLAVRVGPGRGGGKGGGVGVLVVPIVGVAGDGRGQARRRLLIARARLLGPLGPEIQQLQSRWHR